VVGSIFDPFGEPAGIPSAGHPGRCCGTCSRLTAPSRRARTPTGVEFEYRRAVHIHALLKGARRLFNGQQDTQD